MAQAQSTLASTASTLSSSLASLSPKRRRQLSSILLPLFVLFLARKKLHSQLSQLIYRLRLSPPLRRSTSNVNLLSTPQLELAQRDLYLPYADGSRELLVPYAGGFKLAKVRIRPIRDEVFQKDRKVFLDKALDTSESISRTTTVESKSSKDTTGEGGKQGKKRRGSEKVPEDVTDRDSGLSPARGAGSLDENAAEIIAKENLKAQQESKDPVPSSSPSNQGEKVTSGNGAGDKKRPSSRPRVGVNKVFLKQLRALFRIIIPKWRSKEVFMIGIHSFFLVLRTYLSLLVARLDGKLVGDLVSANASGFGRGLLYWFALAVPSMYTNSMIRYLQTKLSLAFRTRLTRYVHDLYLSKAINYYKISNLDTAISGVDQYIAIDINNFCDGVSALYSNVSKPLLDLFIFNVQLFRQLGKWGSIGLAVSYVGTAVVLRKITPSFGKLAAIEAKLEGEYRGMHGRIVTNAEEIAFYNGAKTEKDILTKAYMRLVKHINSILKLRIAFSMSEDFIIKYLWSAFGYILIALPVFVNKEDVERLKEMAGLKQGSSDDEKGGVKSEDGKRVAKRTENYISNRRLLLSLSDAGSRLMYSYKDIAVLAGSTSRVFSLLSTLHRLDTSTYRSPPLKADPNSSKPLYSLANLNGALVDIPASQSVEFDKVPIVAPSPGSTTGGELLVNPLNLKIDPGEHLLVSGANGSGKSSIARVLAGLWPVFEGVVRRPGNGGKKDVFYLPQRPYLSLGSLRDQIIYPHSYPEMVASNRTDSDLLAILEDVHLAYLVEREGGLDTRKEWKDVLSGGEKQRISIARLFYFRSRFGVLDECTSAVSTDVEGLLYQKAKDLGITLITISHRPSLFKYHKHLLRLTSEEGTWELTAIGTAEERLTFDKEMEDLQGKLRNVDGWKARLSEIEKELNFTKS